MITSLRKISGNKSRRGAIALEYALVLAFVAVAVLAALIGLGGKLTNTIDAVGNKTNDAANSTFVAP